MPPVTREMLASYLDDALSERETAEVEQQLRQSDTLRQQLRAADAGARSRRALASAPSGAAIA